MSKHFMFLLLYLRITAVGVFFLSMSQSGPEWTRK